MTASARDADLRVRVRVRERWLRWGRAMPQGSLPPCGGGTRRGVQNALRLFLSSVQQTPPAAVASRSVLRRYPSPCPPPQGGREPWGAHLRNSRNALADGAVKAVRQSND